MTRFHERHEWNCVRDSLLIGNKVAECDYLGIMSENTLINCNVLELILLSDLASWTLIIVKIIVKQMLYAEDISIY